MIEMKDLSSKDLEWLIKPDDQGDNKEIKRVVHIQDDFAVGIDHARLHAINLDKVDEIEGHAIKERVVDIFANSTTIEGVVVNVRFLLDALEGMKSDKDYYKCVRLSVSKASEDKIAIRIDDNSKTAIVMCVKRKSSDDKSD
jgi:hypothetical protein